MKVIVLNINQIIPLDGEYLFGKDDSWGLRIVRKESRLKIYPRMCHHEGASLDGQKCTDDKIKCPWHGMFIRMIADFDLSVLSKQRVESNYHDMILINNKLELTLKSNLNQSSKVCSIELLD